MRKLLVLLALALGMAFASCSGEETLTEEIADKIASYDMKRATIYMWTPEGYELYKSNVAFTIEKPFLVYYETVEYYTELEVKHYLLLDDCCHIFRNPKNAFVELYFK